jgi:hypothetical protein
MRVRRVGRLIKDPNGPMTAKEIGDLMGKAMARNLNHNVMKEEEESQKSPPAPEKPKK